MRLGPSYGTSACLNRPICETETMAVPTSYDCEADPCVYRHLGAVSSTWQAGTFYIFDSL